MGNEISNIVIDMKNYIKIFEESFRVLIDACAPHNSDTSRTIREVNERSPLAEIWLEVFLFSIQLSTNFCCVGDVIELLVVICCTGTQPISDNKKVSHVERAYFLFV